MIKPHYFFETTTADEVAECWDGIPDDLYRALWQIVNHMKAVPNREDSGPFDHIGHENLASHWHRLDDEQRQLLNRLAHERDQAFFGESAGDGPRTDYESGNSAEREPNE